MGCKLVRGETIYFVRNSGPIGRAADVDWFSSDDDATLLPRIYTRSDGRAKQLSPSVVPIEIRTFEA